MEDKYNQIIKIWEEEQEGCTNKRIEIQEIIDACEESGSDYIKLYRPLLGYEDEVVLNRGIDDSMEENEYIISAKCSIEYLKTSKMFLSPKKDLKQVYAWATSSYQCVVNRNEITKINFGGKSDISMREALNKLKKSISKINDDATKLLDASHMIPGEYECITSPEISGLIAHEAFGHGVEMDMFVKNSLCPCIRL